MTKVPPGSDRYNMLKWHTFSLMEQKKLHKLRNATDTD
jgi:hypothetical protein